MLRLRLSLLPEILAIAREMLFGQNPQQPVWVLADLHFHPATHLRWEPTQTAKTAWAGESVSFWPPAGPLNL